MTLRELREKYLAFFESKGHRRFPSAPLIPYDVTGRLDESLLFNGAGMIQFKPYFRGTAQPEHKRLITCQKCVRTGDIDEVGDTSHLTFFEMLGNFSFGDYFKAEAIAFSWEFLTSPQWLALDPTRLSFTVFEDDDEAYNEWFKWISAAGIDPATRVFRLGEETNYWPAGAFSKGPPGPCGPNSEMFYWVPSEPSPLWGRGQGEGAYTRDDWLRDESEGKWLEIWNDVFIQYEWQGHLRSPERPSDGFVKEAMPDLPFRSIDTGMGLDRTAAVLMGGGSVYQTDSFAPIFAKIDELEAVARPSRSWVSPTVPVGEPLRGEIEVRQGANLPHWEADGATYFVTFRLVDSVPREKREEWAAERERLAAMEASGALNRKESLEYLKLFSERVSEYLDEGHGSCLLRTAAAAEIVASALKHFDGDRYRLHAWVVMPNHVHAVVTPSAGQELQSILHSWKSFTAHEINKALARSGDVWMDESYDHLVRDDADFYRCFEYILSNPAKANLSNWPYVGTSADIQEPYATGTVADTHDRDGHATATARRIIADHIRTAVFCIADGVLPGNSGRGYVLRRLIRRAVLKGQRVLGFEEPFFHRVYEGVVEAMGDFYPELTERRDVIVETLKNEEEQFRRTLVQGSELLLRTLEQIRPPGTQGPQLEILSGALAFQLYDTFGFPLEVTQELAAEAGVPVDIAGYERALKEAQERSRGGQERESVYGHSGMFNLIIQIDEEEQTPTQTVFVGYDQSSAQTEIVGVLPVPSSGSAQPSKASPDVHEDNSPIQNPKSKIQNLVIALKESPFYAESGGQVGDTGTIAGGGFEGRVLEVIKQNGVWVHEVEPTKLPVNLANKSDREATQVLQKKLFRLKVEAEIDLDRRRRVVKNHTATHLLHAALRHVLGKHVTQAGSYVGPDRLRFDFTHGKALSDQEIKEVERIVNEQVWRNTAVTIYPDLAISEAKAKGAMALFGEKYGDRVRMVEIGDFSRELCGGTHARHTGEIGLFRIVHEASAASGVRRIEALTGEGAYEWVLDLVSGLQEAATRLKLSPKSGVRELVHGIDKLHEAQRDLKQRLEKARAQGPAAGAAQVGTVGSVELAVEAMRDADAKDAAALADSLAAGQANRVVLVGSTSEGKVTFVCKVGPEALHKGAHAGNLVKEVAKIAGGGGGGRADFATAGGKDPQKLDAALAAAADALRSQLKSA